MTRPIQDANGLTPTEAKVARLIATAGRIDVEALTDTMEYRHARPLFGVLRSIRIKLRCVTGDLPETLCRLGYDSRKEPE